MRCSAVCGRDTGLLRNLLAHSIELLSDLGAQGVHIGCGRDARARVGAELPDPLFHRPAQTSALLASSARTSKAAGSLTANSESCLRFKSTPARFSPAIRRE